MIIKENDGFNLSVAARSTWNMASLLIRVAKGPGGLVMLCIVSHVIHMYIIRK